MRDRNEAFEPSHAFRLDTSFVDQAIANSSEVETMFEADHEVNEMFKPQPSHGAL